MDSPEWKSKPLPSFLTQSPAGPIAKSETILFVPPPIFPVPTKPLYSVNAVTVATLLGSVLAGGYLMAANLRRCDKPAAARKVLVGSVIALMASVAVGFALPFLALPILLAVRRFCSTTQSEMIDLHQQRGGPMESAWKAAGIGVISALITLLIVAALALAWVYFGPDERGKVVHVDSRHHIFRSGSVTDEQARNVDQLLIAAGLAREVEIDIALKREGASAIISFVVAAGAWEDEKVNQTFTELAQEAAPAMDVQWLTARLLDVSLTVRRESPARTLHIPKADERNR